MLPKKTKRLFIAIALPDEIRKILSGVSHYYQHPSLSWMPAQNLHITVHFIGMVQQEMLPDILQLTSCAAMEAQPFSLTFAQLKVVSKRRKPVMLWAQFESNDAFTQLALQLSLMLPDNDSRTPVPHVTLARIKEGGLRELPELPFVKKFSINVKHIELWESELSASAPVYKMLERFELGK